MTQLNGIMSIDRKTRNSNERLARSICCFLLVLLVKCPGSVDSFSIDNNVNNNNNMEDVAKVVVSKSTSSSISRSPWATSKWKLSFNFGREEGSWMPEEWGKSGGRLVLSPIEVEITSDRPTQQDEDPMLKRNAFVMTLPNISNAATTYMTMKGQQTVTFGFIGGWKIRMPWGGTGGASSQASTIAKQRGHASKLTAFCDLQSDIEKGDISLKKGERIYLTANCWREDDLENALKQIQPIRFQYLQKQADLEAQLSHTTGDRRLDGTDPVQTLLGMKDTASLVLARDQALRQYEDAQTLYPNIEREMPSLDDFQKQLTPDEFLLDEGPWPGQVEWLSLEPRFLLVRRNKLLNEEYHVIGTWKAEPVFDETDDDYKEPPSIF